MGRQTAFPGIIIKNVRAKAGSSGQTLEFEEGLPEKIPTERIQSFLNNLRLFDSDYVDSELKYTLLVAAPYATAAQTKARAFVRLKNPFEPDLIDVSDTQLNSSIGPLDNGRKVYQVEVTVSK